MALMLRHPVARGRASKVSGLLDAMDMVMNPGSMARTRQKFSERNMERLMLLRNLSRYNLAMKRSRSRG